MEPRSDVADERPVGVMDVKTHAPVQLGRRGVLFVHVQHRHRETALGQRGETSHRQRATEPPAGEVGIRGDGVNLPERRGHVVVHLGPTERRQPPVDLVQEEPGGVEPGLALACRQGRQVPSTLLGVIGERPIVHFQPARLVAADDEGAHRDPAGSIGQRKRATHLHERPSRTQTDAPGDLVMGAGRFEYPPMHMSAPLAAHHVERRAEQLWADGQRLVAVMRIDNQLERPRIVAPTQLGIGHRMIVARFECHQAREPRTSAVNEIQPQMIRQRTIPVGALGGVEERLHFGNVHGAHGTLDRQSPHTPDATGSVAEVGKPRTPKGRAKVVMDRLADEYPVAICELTHRNPYELLAATILSAQCTDARVNMVTPVLFGRYRTPADLAVARQEDVESIVHSTGFYSSKARNLIGMATALVERFDGEVPTAMEDLVTIPGTGRKTANVVRSVAFDLPGLPVDTHVLRLSGRLGLTTLTDPVKVELELGTMIPPAQRGRFSLRLILHGRRVCDARRPRCGDCVLVDICPGRRL
jgi:endonuclease III